MNDEFCTICGHHDMYHEGRCYYGAQDGESCDCHFQRYLREGA